MSNLCSLLQNVALIFLITVFKIALKKSLFLSLKVIQCSCSFSLGLLSPVCEIVGCQLNYMAPQRKQALQIRG